MAHGLGLLIQELQREVALGLLQFLGLVARPARSPADSATVDTLAPLTYAPWEGSDRAFRCLRF